MRWYAAHSALLAGADDPARLTPSQADALHTMLALIGERAQRLNLYGGPGTGKTFLARALRHRMDGLYLAHPEARKSISDTFGAVIVDNAPTDRADARVIFGDLFWRGASTVILVTRRPIHDDVRTVSLTLTGADTLCVAQTAARVLGYSPSPFDHSKAGLWLLLTRFTLSS